MFNAWIIYWYNRWFVWNAMYLQHTSELSLHSTSILPRYHNITLSYIPLRHKWSQTCSVTLVDSRFSRSLGTPLSMLVLAAKGVELEMRHFCNTWGILACSNPEARIRNFIIRPSLESLRLAILQDKTSKPSDKFQIVKGITMSRAQVSLIVRCQLWGCQL